MNRLIRKLRELLFGWQPHKCPSRIRVLCEEAAAVSRDLIIDAGVTPMRDPGRPWTVKTRPGELQRAGIWHWHLASGRVVFDVWGGSTITVAHKPGHASDVSRDALLHAFGHHWTNSPEHDPRLSDVLPYWR